jgi:hypothetical protein
MINELPESPENAFQGWFNHTYDSQPPVILRALSKSVWCSLLRLGGISARGQRQVGNSSYVILDSLSLESVSSSIMLSEF